jgi:hypothetical protein
MKKALPLSPILLVIAFFLALTIHKGYGQTCAGSTPANPGAQTGSNYTSTTINPSDGKVSWFTGGTVGGATITISANSTLIIKTGSFLTLTGATTIPAGSTIYIESGAGLSIPGSLTLQGTFTNLGLLTITGSNFLQVNAGTFYNDGTINASSSYIHLNATASKFLNGGTATFTWFNFQIATGTNPVCMRAGSVFNLLSSNSGSVIAGTGAFPTGGLFQYNSNDITGNTVCATPNPARVNYLASFTPTNGVTWGPTGYVTNNANITVVGSTPSGNGTGLGFGASVNVTSGTGYSASTPQTYSLSTQSPAPTIVGTTSGYFQFCKGSSVLLPGLVSGGTNLLWYTVATGGTGSSTAPTVSTASTGLQTFWVSQNVSGCEGPRSPININIVSTTANSLTAGNNGPICTGGTLTLSATQTGVSSWSWTGPNSYTSTTQNPTVSTSATTAMTGTYYILTQQTSGTCYNSASTIVTIGAPAQPSAFTTSTTPVCQSQSNVTYTVPAVNGATSYTWTYSGTGATITGTTNSVSINFSSIASSGTLSVTATNTCGTSTATTLSITVNPGIYFIPTAGLIAYYKLDGNANDETGNYVGTLQAAPSSTTDRYGNSNLAYNFNGSTQYISTGTTVNPATASTPPANFTISVWFNTTTTTGGKLVGFGNNQTGSSGNFDRHIYMANDGQIYFGVYPNAIKTITTTGSYNTGVWHMATASLSSTNGMKLYIDGVLVSSDATTTTGQSYNGFWRIAYDNTGGWTNSPSSNFFNGSLDDVAIYNTELTAAQVSSLYANSNSASSNSPVCQNASLNLTAPTITGASYSWTGPNSFSSASQNPTVSSMTVAKQGSYVLTMTVSGCSVVSYAAGYIDPNANPISQIPTSNLIARYKLNGNANDVSGSYNNGVLQNSPTSTTDRFGNTNSAYSFNGSSQFISTTTQYTGLNDFTYSIWFNTTTTNGGKLIGFGDSQTGQSGNFDRHIYMNNAGVIYFGVYPGGIKTINSVSSYNDGTWHLATASLSSTAGMKLYIDGALVASDASTTSGQSYSGYFKLAFDNLSGWTSSPSSNYFNGSLDDVLIYNTALTAAQVTTLYNNPDGAGSNSAVCIGSTLTLSAPTVGGMTYSWTGPSSFSSSSQNPSLTFLPANAGTYTLTVVASSGCTITAYALTKLNTATAGQWTGYTSTSWQTANNWCGGGVPTSTTDVTIPSVTNLPVNSGTANARNITINSSASLTNASTGIVNVYGNFTNNGTFTDNGIYTSAGVVNFTGSSAQSITGATTFNNLTINNSSGVTLNSTSTVNGILTLTTGAFATNGNLNQNLYNGAIAGTGSGSTTGNIRFFKTIWGDRYHYLSAPITGLTAADWNDNVTIKFGAYSNLYSYDETKPDTNMKVGWTAVTSTATSLATMKGYALFFPQFTYSRLLDVSGAYNHNTASVSSGTLTNTPSTIPIAKPSSDGWNLLGNPYPSTVDWNASSGLTKTGIDNAIYMWDGRTNRYVSYVSGVGTNGGTQYIGSMQGFFVKVTASGGTGSLTMTNSSRVTSTLRDVWRTENTDEDKILRLTVSDGTLNDETVIRFNNASTDQFDSDYDAYKLLNDPSMPSVFSSSASADYSVNSLPLTSLKKTIPLQLDVPNNAQYSWTADLNNFTSTDTLILQDRLLGTSQNLSDNPVYNVSLNKGNYSGRFYLLYNQKQTASSSSDNSGIEISAIQKDVFVLFSDENTTSANVSIFDALGKVVYVQENMNVSSERVDINLLNATTGIYIVKVQTSSGTKTQQVYIQ